ncbi:hypothetical protein HHI36_021228 [Cryptolaemus montrouzieri]|uniref:Reverse transcriptase domain-containing protein n=1 Tax=Cryptolaemus montrouzieri TaxID=559131 RepID=A0ABD2MWH7_9CUCU
MDYTIFADDAGFTSEGDSLDMVEGKAQRVEKRAIDWFAANKLALNADKTQSMLLTLRHLEGGKNTESVKFLGIYLDPTIKWDKHIEYVSGLQQDLRNIEDYRDIYIISDDEVMRANLSPRSEA